METAELVLKFTQSLSWPIVVVIGLLKYGQSLIDVFSRSKVKLSLFGVTIEANIADLEKVLMSPIGGSLTDRQWTLLEKIQRDGSVSIETEHYVMTLENDLQWIRPLRNAGLILTLPDGKYIEDASSLEFTQLGRLLIAARPNRNVTAAKTSQ